MEQESKEDDLDDRIEKTIDNFRHKMHAISAMAETQLKHAKENQEHELAALRETVEAAVTCLTSTESNTYDIARAGSTYLDSRKSLEFLRFPQEAMLAEDIFISVFSCLDAYLGQLLQILFSRQPEILNSAGSKSVDFVNVLQQSRREIIDSLIDKEIESLIRDSYVACFDRLANRFDVGTLKNFENWRPFVECSQRRNVITHCGGIVSRQYINVCKSEGVQLPEALKVGHEITVSKEYLSKSIRLAAEVGFKVGQVLWRKCGETSIERADNHLGGVLIFELLKREEWVLALRMGEFGRDCATRKYKKPRNERSVKTILINHAQGAKWSGDNETAMAIVNEADWSGSGLEFCLAVECLKENWGKAAELMRQIGPNSPNMPVHAYCNWPIFRHFRGTAQFSTMFREVFGVEFAEEVTRETPPLEGSA